MELNGDENRRAPDAARVAARAMALAAVAYRGFLENDISVGEIGAEEAENARRDIFPWLEELGVTSELEPAEADLIATPAGRLGPQATIDACWRIEGLAVLAWALDRAPLPDVHTMCELAKLSSALGLFRTREATPLPAPQVRDRSEVQYWEETYITVHWRLRQFQLKPYWKDFASFAANSKWPWPRLDELEIIDGELAIRGVKIDCVDEDTLSECMSIAQERRVALNWLLGHETLYSKIETHT